MRTIPFLLLAAALVLAGCASDDEEPGTTTPTPQSPTPDDTGAGNETGDDNMTEPDDNESTEETPTEPTPKEVVNDTFDYASGQAAGPDGHVVTFDVPEGYATLTFVLTGEKGDDTLPTTGLGVNQKLTVLMPDGTAAFSLTPGSDTEEERAVAATSGTWSLKYEGTGNVKVTTAATASGAAAASGAGDEPAS